MMENKELLVKLLEKTGKLKDYVILKKDDKGFYIEYAFCSGAPHDNRCLSWYDSYQEKAYERNGWFNQGTKEKIENYKKTLLTNRLSKVGRIFKLENFTCSWENYCDKVKVRDEAAWKKSHPDLSYDITTRICKVGRPALDCVESTCKNWTYEEPVKCACWLLGEELNLDTITFTLSLQDIKDLLDKKYDA